MTAPDRQPDRLPERAEALLDGWPAPGRGALEWEDAAARTMERVRETAIGSTPDLLLEAPLAEESGEGSLSPVLVSAEASPESEDEPPMLANIARAVVASAAAASAKDVAREMMMAAEEGRRSAPPAPPQSREAYGRGSGRAESRSGASQMTPVQAMHEATARSELPERDTAPKRSTLGLIAFGGGAALALAAGAALYVSVRGEGRTVLTEPSAEASRAVAGPTATAETPPEPKAAPAQSVVALDGLPAAPGKADLQGSAKSAAPGPATGLTKDSLAFRMKNAAPGAGKLVLEERNEEDVPPEAAEAPAPAPAQGAKQQAPSEETGLPPQPSLGAVQAAVGSVMTGARSCLSGQDAGSKATVKFGANGRVISVVLSGPAAGTPAESCVRSALMGARVPPFSEPSFAASLTIRPP